MTLTSQVPQRRVLLIHPALAPYRLDQFNRLAALCDLTVVFLYDNLWNHPFDQQSLRSQATFKQVYLLRGPHYKGRVLRWGLLRLIRQLKPDVVVSYEFSFTTQWLILLKALGLLKPRLGSTVDDSLDICHAVQSRLRAVARELAVRRLDFMAVLSPEVAAFYAQRYGLSPESMVVSPLLQDPERLRSPPEALDRLASTYLDLHGLRGCKVVLFVGRFIPEKGLAGFLAHVAASLKARPDVRLVLVGDGEERPAVAARIDAEGLGQQVVLPGRIEGEALRAWYVAAAGFVLPSTYEPFGAVVNEALIFGLPVLCSRAAGSASLAVQGGGSLFDPRDSADTAAAFEAFVDRLEPMREACVAARGTRVDGGLPQFQREWEKVLGR